MRKSIIYLFAIVALLSSCQKDEIITPQEKSDTNVLETLVPTSGTNEVMVYVGPAPYPNIDGELQLALNKTLPYPVSVQFKVKDQTGYGENLVSETYTIPAGQKYLTCDIYEYTKSMQDRPVIEDSTSANGTFWVYETSPQITTKMITPYLQIWKVQTSSNVNVLVDYSIAKISYTLDGVDVSFAYRAYATTDLSTLSSVSSKTFYKPSSGGGSTGGGGQIGDPIGGPKLPPRDRIID